MVRSAVVGAPMTDTKAHAADASDLPELPELPELPPIKREQAEPDFPPVIRSKIQPPPLRSTTLTRQRLIDRLHEATASRVTLLIAEAGYGKTTLLADFAARSGQRTLWYRLDPTDGDAITWTNYLIAACREVDPSFGTATLSLLKQIGPSGPPNHVIVATLISELRQIREAPTTLVLDDFHTVESNAEAREILERLVRDAPQWLHFVISSRRRPELKLGRLEAMGELAQVGTDELRFAIGETHDLFADRYNTPLDAEVLAVVDRRTRGWAASLQLFFGSIRNRPPSAARSLASVLSGAERPIYDFLAEEVLTNIPTDVEFLIVRASILDRVVPEHALALLDHTAAGASLGDVQSWLDDADRLGLLSRSSETSSSRQIHPLLRDFLTRRLHTQIDGAAISNLHERVAKAVESDEPLTAARHYLEAGLDLEAMRCVGRSVMDTIGSGRWGAASDLVDRLKGVPADPAVAAIQARRYIEAGELDRAAHLLGSVDTTASPALVRAVIRHTRLSLGWRTSDRQLMLSTLEEARADPETPAILRDIIQIQIDASPLSVPRVPFAVLSRRLEQMAVKQAGAGYSYFAAISLHNAAVAAQSSGDPKEAIRLGQRALTAFEQLADLPTETYSTHAVLAGCWLEMGDRSRAEQHFVDGLSSGREHGDVPAEFALLWAITGQRDRAIRMVDNARTLMTHGLSDIQGVTQSLRAEAFLALAASPDHALELLGQIPAERPLDVGDTLGRLLCESIANLISGRRQVALSCAQRGLDSAREVAAGNDEAKFKAVVALAMSDPARIGAAIASLAGRGQLGVLEIADAIGESLAQIQPLPPELLRSMRSWPERWLPVLRRQLAKGDTPSGRVAAVALDDVGSFEDVPRLRAYTKAYGRRARTDDGLGLNLAKRVAPPLEIRDLGRVVFVVGTREVALSRSRRKAAALLMYLVTRPRLTATREQVLDDLWPDADPGSASNSLNQSLFFLRRNIDPWYEDGLSVDYVHFEGDLVWLDADLTRIQSSTFIQSARDARRSGAAAADASSTLRAYAGRFAPEFEYDEWAMNWRHRLHAEFLGLATASLDQLESSGDLSEARDIASHVLDVDSTAREIEQRLVRIYWKLGARSAALSQYEHLVSLDRADGLEPPSITEVTG
ncbi:MAG: BTAD domain-containing putative transcriptional regulator [Chloroflexota bacterium]